MKVVWSARSRQRVVEIARYIAQDSSRSAERWVSDLFAAVARLSDFPLLGKSARDVSVAGVRELVVGDYRVFYEVGTEVVVLTIRRASQLLVEQEFDPGD